MTGEVAKVSNNSEWKKRVLEKGTRSPRVVVDFFASWCPPCRQISPIFENLSKTYTNVKFLKIDVEENKAVATKCGIQSMPTFQFYFEGDMINTLMGADKEKLEFLIKELASKETQEPSPEEGGDADAAEKKGVREFFKRMFKK
ncbi:hypothetical protein BSKO_06212 [Bryopsis sp. KO-2023]|nr:hypothetical protein BSKO_06212 [Bryopsis sp. KO-2023]